VVNNAQSASESGWKAFEDSKNRYWLLDNQQQAVFRPFRECSTTTTARAWTP
jgi:hypothetical protein